MTEVETADRLKEYLSDFDSINTNQTHKSQVELYIKGLLSNLERKSVEPIALFLKGPEAVRGLQNFLARSTFPEQEYIKRYQTLVADRLSAPESMLCMDESDFVKKGTYSPGVARQYCGRPGKNENCQAGVFLAYSNSQGHALLDARLYIPKKWFGPEYEEQRKREPADAGTDTGDAPREPLCPGRRDCRRKEAEFEAKYDAIVETAAKEYEDEPPSDYYRDGYNPYLRMVEHKHNHLLFLSEPLVNPDNNLCEWARILKGKINQAILLRSFEHLTYFCECLSVLEHFATGKEDTLFQSVKEIFKREKTIQLKSKKKSESCDTALYEGKTG